MGSYRIRHLGWIGNGGDIVEELLGNVLVELGVFLEPLLNRSIQRFSLGPGQIDGRNLRD